MPHKVIVVGTDGSKRATVAVEEALSLAKPFGATVHVVMAVDPSAAAGFADSRTAQFETSERVSQVAKCQKSVTERAAKHDVPMQFHKIGKSDPADGILEIAQQVDADLVVVGNRGMSGVKRFVLGSVPNKISHQCACNLLIVNTELQ
jgi:nucleotide-binding universal stress UspA family protein